MALSLIPDKPRRTPLPRSTWSLGAANLRAVNPVGWPGGADGAGGWGEGGGGFGIICPYAVGK